jgi:hypothetical protein
MTRGQKSFLLFCMLFAAAAYARNKLQKIETHSGASPGVVTIKGDDFQVATGGTNGECLVWDDTTDAGVAWDSCAAGGGDSVLVDTAATVDPDFQDGDVDFTYAAGVVTATVGCSGCIDATDMGTDSVAADEIAAGAVGASELAADSLTPADLDTVAAAGAPEDEYCLTYEHGTTEFAWQVCSSGGGDSITVNSGATVDPNFLNGDIDWTYAGTDITATVGCSQCVSYSEVQNVSATNRLLGRDTAGAGVIEEITMEAALDMVTTWTTAVLYHNSGGAWGPTNWTTDGTNITPTGDASGTLGSGVLRWNELYVTHIDNNGGGITVDADLTPDVDNGQDLGSAALRWNELYVTHVDNNGGDITVDADILPDVAGTQDLGSLAVYWSNTYSLLVYLNTLEPISGGVVNVGGILRPDVNDTYSLGDATFKWSGVYASSIGANSYVQSTAGGMSFGNSSTTAHTFTTDGTGNAEIVLPNESIGSAEILDNSLVAGDIAADAIGTSELSAAAVCEAWPVDSIFISMSSANPNASLGCGTWSAFATGRMLIGIDGSKTWSSAGATGGNVDMDHDHDYTQVIDHVHPIAAGQGSHAHGMAEGTTDGSGTFMDRSNAAAATTATTDAATLPAMTTSNPTGSVGATGQTTEDKVLGGGDGEPVPWIAVYMWRRTA